MAAVAIPAPAPTATTTSEEEAALGQLLLKELLRSVKEKKEEVREVAPAPVPQASLLQQLLRSLAH